jgi:hypothetical protein
VSWLADGWLVYLNIHFVYPYLSGAFSAALFATSPAVRNGIKLDTCWRAGGADRWNDL